MHTRARLVIINKKTRNIMVADDGDGVSKEKYEAALESVMRTMKTRDKLGQFGMGMLSPLAKCKWYKLTSCSKEDQTYLEWTFDTEVICAQVDDVHVPHRICTDIRFVTDLPLTQKEVKPVKWRTLIEVHGYTDDKYIGRIPSAQVLFDEIAHRYREKMLENGVKISINIVSDKGIDFKDACAEPYYGHRLPDAKYYDASVGHSVFRLYLARKNEKGEYRGAGVLVGEADNAFRFSFKIFARSIPGVLSANLIEALKSGLFEGDILTERTKLHSNRKSFEPSDSLLGFCEAIETWYGQVGKSHYEIALDSKGAERYKALGEDLKKTLEGLINDPRFAAIFKPLKGASLESASSSNSKAEKSDSTKPPKIFSQLPAHQSNEGED
jgi:hypothetical protein